MADKITWNDKVSLVTDPTIAEINKVTDGNMNEIKSVTNTNADQLDETIVYDENDITTNTKALIKQGKYKYINSEIAIGSSNDSNIPVWFKVSNYKNIFNKLSSIQKNQTYRDNGNITYLDDSFIQLEYIKVKANTSYTISTTNDYTTISNYRLIICEYNSSQTFIQRNMAAKSKTLTITTTANTEYIRICGMLQYIDEIQVEENSTATTYEPYIVPEILINNKSFYNSDNFNDIKITTATQDTTYVGNIEQNQIVRVGKVVNFDFIFTTTGTWTSTTKFFTGLPKPATTKIRFVALKTNPEVPLKFQLNADGSIQNGYSNFEISSGQIIEGHISYITID